MWWELDSDKPEETGQSLVRTVREALGQLEWRENELDYPGSSEFLRCTMVGTTFADWDQNTTI